jgi:phosphate transport system protein
VSLFFIREIDRLNNSLLKLAAIVEENLRHAVRAIEERDAQLATSVIEQDTEIDTMEVDLEEECLKILALHQPVALDLRFVVAVLKINNDLERIGDLSSNIAERVFYITHLGTQIAPLDVSGMAERVQWMVRTSLDSLVRQDLKLANRVLAEDDIVDRLHRESYEEIERILRDSNTRDGFESIIRWLSVSRSLERIADHATNIAEDVIYMLSGEIVRHQPRPDEMTSTD